MKTTLTVLALILEAAPALAQQGTPGAHFLENWDTDGDGRVTLAEAEARRGDVFAAFDADEDGALRGEEYDLFDQARAQDQQGQGHGAGYAAADQCMERAFNDKDGGGAVSRDEFLAGTAGWLQLMDRDGDGVITTADFGRG
ncbi:MAG: EF-hand domain-containing protein [Rhodobacterales bacterium]|nr:EF-hand domain-containing protein [Rhodobacterales bacterium]